MTAAYSVHHSTASDGNCGFCQDALTKRVAVAHEGEGFKHAMHYACMKLLANQGITSCLYCRVETDCSLEIKENRPIKWKKVCLQEAKSMAANAAMGFVVGVGVFASQFGLQDEAARQVAITEAAAISLGIGGYLASGVLSNKGYHKAADAVIFPLILSVCAGIAPPAIAGGLALKGLVNYGSATAYEPVSGLTALSGIVLSAGTIIGTSIASVVEQKFKVDPWYLGKIGAALGAAASSIALGIAGLDFERRRYALYHQELTFAEHDVALNRLLLTVVGTSVAVVALSTVIGGFLGRRFARL